MPKSLDKLESLIAPGELDGPDGFQAQTANGTAFWAGLGWNQKLLYRKPEAIPGGAWKAGRSNRTGE